MSDIDRPLLSLIRSAGRKMLQEIEVEGGGDALGFSVDRDELSNLVFNIEFKKRNDWYADRVLGLVSTCDAMLSVYDPPDIRLIRDLNLIGR